MALAKQVCDAPLEVADVLANAERLRTAREYLADGFDFQFVMHAAGVRDTTSTAHRSPSLKTLIALSRKKAGQT